MAASDSGMPFTVEEREMYAFLRDDPNNHSKMFNMTCAYPEWTAENFASAALMIFRSPIPLRTTTMTWASYDVVEENQRRIVFKRRN